jgi:hypothetical protein
MYVHNHSIYNFSLSIIFPDLFQSIFCYLIFSQTRPRPNELFSNITTTYNNKTQKDNKNTTECGALQHITTNKRFCWWDGNINAVSSSCFGFSLRSWCFPAVKGCWTRSYWSEPLVVQTFVLSEYHAEDFNVQLVAHAYQSWETSVL